MWLKRIFFLLLSLILISDFADAQVIPAKKDSTHIYKNIETYSKKGKFTRFMYSLVFRPVTHTSKKRKYKKLINRPLSSFEGKIIRHINIETLDPFGYSIGDTIVAAPNFISKTGNSLHIKSQPITIRNLLLIRQNQPFDALLVKESERLVRTRNYITDVLFYVKTSSVKADSVDIFIRVLDIWSIIPSGSASTSGINIGLSDNNFMGLGHTFQNIYARDYTQRNNSFKANYTIPNIKNTYIATVLHYDDMLGSKNSNKSVTFDRPFFSPFAKWAAGVSFSQQFRADSFRMSNMVFMPQRFKYNTQDYWAGNGFRIFRGNTEDKRTTNFISTVRFLRIRYLEKPPDSIDIQHNYSNENFYMAGIGVSTRKYVQEKYIFKFGITEDVPIGKVFSLTGGYQERNNAGRLYLGGRISFGNYYSWGYLSSDFEYGTFFRGSKAEQGVITTGVNYFSGLFEIGKWKFRQFVKPQIAIGINRPSYDTLTINDGFGLNGFNSLGLSGTRRLLFTLQTQSYTPWNFIGFRFGPFLTCTAGMLGNASTGFKNCKLYSQIGIGVLIKNESLILNTFQISIAFYPSIPGKGQNVFKPDVFKTTDFGFRYFVIGKPAKVVFQ